MMQLEDFDDFDEMKCESKKIKCQEFAVILHTLITYHIEMNEQIENANKIVKNYLRAYVQYATE